MTTQRPEELAERLILDEQVSLMSGQDFWSVAPVERLGIGSLIVTDGPNGARGGGSLVGGVRSAAFPVGIALGATWDVDVLAEVGIALAQEARDKGAHVLLAPTINLQRGPLNGRNFECYSEDPCLTAGLAVAYVTGLQSQGVAATVKHFVGNESEIERTTISSDIDERTLRELYLLPFERAVKEGRAWAVMTSYNRLNGTFTSEHSWLLTEVLRGDWGFDGAVMSDWFGAHSTGPSVTAGLDLEMPGPTRDRGDKLVVAVQAGDVSAEAVKAAAANVLRLSERSGALDSRGPRNEIAVDRPETRALIRRAGAAGMVLLKNDGVLPLDGARHIAVVGPNAKAARCMGGGSAQLNAHRQVSAWDGLENALGGNRLSHAAGCTNHRFEPVVTGKFRVDWFDNTELAGAPVHSETIVDLVQFLTENLAGGKVGLAGFSLRVTGGFAPAETGIHRVGVHCTGRGRVLIDGTLVTDAWTGWTRGTTFFEEGCDPVIGEVALTAGTTHELVFEFRATPTVNLDHQAFYVGIGRPLGDAEIAEACAAAHEADLALVCIGRNAEWDTEGSDLPSMALPGRQDELVSAIAAAAKKTVVLLQTGGPVEMPWAREVDAILQAWYPGQEAGDAIADVLTGAAEPGGRLPQGFPKVLADAPTMGRGAEAYPGRNGRVVYGEGLYIGHRHHDRAGIAAAYPFGFGLGYAEIAPGGIDVQQDGTEVAVTVPLSNVSARDGSQVVQLYVEPLDAPVDRPKAELKAFAKVAVPAGATAEARLTLGPRDFAWFDSGRRAWVVSPGRYRLRAALHAADPGHGTEIVIDAETTLAP